MATTRWQDERSEQDSHDYVQRFVDLAAEGADLHGEARVVDALLPPASHVLDAGCGTARVGAELVRRGHTVTAVDADPVLMAAAPALDGLTVLHADLAELDLGAERFDGAVLAGNVLVYVTPGAERAVLRRLHAHVNPGGLVVTGFATDRAYTLAELDRDALAVGMEPESRFATWDLRPWRAGADWAVSVLRVQ